jgi:hypothetical protein
MKCVRSCASFKSVADSSDEASARHFNGSSGKTVEQTRNISTKHVYRDDGQLGASTTCSTTLLHPRENQPASTVGTFSRKAIRSWAHKLELSANEALLGLSYCSSCAVVAIPRVRTKDPGLLDVLLSFLHLRGLYPFNFLRPLDPEPDLNLD